MSNDLLSFAETTDLLKVHPETLRRWDRDGVLSAIRINDRGDRRWRRHDVLTFMQKKLQLSNSNGSLLYKDYEIIPNSNGFEHVTNMFAQIAKYVVKKNGESSGFVFAVPGMELFKYDGNSPDLEEIALNKIKEFIDRKKIHELDVYTFEFSSDEFFEVLFPNWWRDTYGFTLVENLRAEVLGIHGIKAGLAAWRITIHFRIKQGGNWKIMPFGSNNQFTEYFVEISGTDLSKLGYNPSDLSAAAFALKYIRQRFNDTKDADGKRSLEKIEEDKVAFWNGKDHKNKYILDFFNTQI